MPPSLLSLPYDIRYAIYQHLFPHGEQIYIQAYSGRLHTILPEDGLSVSVLLSCRQLHTELSGYLYNNYLFNIIGIKSDCLETYRIFETVLRKYAKCPVRINAFSNGDHSATMCISMQAGDAKMDVLRRRGRGEPKTIREMELERLGKPQDRKLHVLGAAFLGAIFAAVTALVLRACVAA